MLRSMSYRHLRAYPYTWHTCAALRCTRLQVINCLSDNNIYQATEKLNNTIKTDGREMSFSAIGVFYG